MAAPRTTTHRRPPRLGLTQLAAAGLLTTGAAACSADLGGSGEWQEGTSLDGGGPASSLDGGSAGSDASRLDADVVTSDSSNEEPAPAEGGDASPEAGGGLGGTDGSSDGGSGALDAGRDAQPADAQPADAQPADAQPDGTLADASICSRGPIDLVWAIDGSASMLGEITDIGAQLRRLLTQLTMAGVDVRMTVLSPFDPLALAAGEATNRYRFVMADIQNDNALRVLGSSFETYADWLREGVRTDVAVASDSDSSLQATAFRAQMEAKLQHGFTFHALAAPRPPLGPCRTAEKPGAQYEALASQTDGLFASICTTNWSTTFDSLSTAILVDAPIVCQ